MPGLKGGQHHGGPAVELPLQRCPALAAADFGGKGCADQNVCVHTQHRLRASQQIGRGGRTLQLEAASSSAQAASQDEQIPLQVSLTWLRADPSLGIRGISNCTHANGNANSSMHP